MCVRVSVCVCVCVCVRACVRVCVLWQVLAVEDLERDDIVKRALAWCPKELKDSMTAEALQKHLVLASLSQVLFITGDMCVCGTTLFSYTELNSSQHRTYGI